MSAVYVLQRPKFENRPAKPMPKSGFDGKRTQPGHTGRFEKK